MKGKKTAATGVIKESQNYGEGDAYNTACDLMALEILMNYHNFHKKNNSNFHTAFMTNDKNLTKIGALLLNNSIEGTDGERMTATVSFPFDIFSDDLETKEIVESFLK